MATKWIESLRDLAGLVYEAPDMLKCEVSGSIVKLCLKVEDYEALQKSVRDYMVDATVVNMPVPIMVDHYVVLMSGLTFVVTKQSPQTVLNGLGPNMHPYKRHCPDGYDRLEDK